MTDMSTSPSLAATPDETQTQAQIVTAMFKGNLPHSRDAFIAKLARKKIPVIFRSFTHVDTVADLVLFADGSSFFAESDSYQANIYQLYPLDWQDDLCGDEFLELLPDAAELFDFSDNDTRVQPFDEDECPDFTAHLMACLQVHPNPPEATRDLITESEHEFEWRDASTADRAREILAVFAGLMDPGASSICIRASNQEGMTPTQKARDEQMKELSASMSIGSGQENMAAMYDGVAYVEIDESSSAFHLTCRVNEVMAWLSRRVLEDLGKPVGWSVDYNDGDHNRISGYTAYSASEILDIPPLSNHDRLQQSQMMKAWLQEQELLEGFEQIAAANDIDLRW